MFVVDQSIKVCPAILRTCLTSLKKKKKKKKTAPPGKKMVQNGTFPCHRSDLMGTLSVHL